MRFSKILPRYSYLGECGIYAPYIAPFAIFALCTYMGPLFNLSQGLVYPIKTSLVAVCLIYYYDLYKSEMRLVFDWLAVVSGILVFLIWILSEGFYPQIAHSEFNPYSHASSYGVFLVIAFRLIGASLVVPVMEELFWRSFALRFLVSSNFRTVTLGKFSWFSFVFVSLAFGLEHHRWLAGIIAGMIYAGLLYRSKNLFVPILSHGVTNLLLGLYVISTHSWSFW